MSKFKTIVCLSFLFLSIFGLANPTDLTKYLPKGYDTTGKTDYTSYLQKGLDSNDNVLIPNFPILVNKNGLKLSNNQTVNFQSKSKLVMMPNAETNYGILHIVKVKNVKVINPILVGDRDKHTGTKGEWGMGISILSSQNIQIINPSIKNCWGDGIYIGEDRTLKQPNVNIKISGGIIDNNRRNGISVISVKGLEIKDIEICNTNGVNPMSGIDIEPNNNRQFLQNIVLSNIKTVNNKNEGVKVYLKYYVGSKNEISIDIENLNDSKSLNGLTYSGVLKEDFLKAKNMKGYIKVKNFKSDKKNQIKQHRRTDLPINFKVN
ncbi:right-handed parallel beta-helix repeat-containing protein [Empedobacter brevis]|uniref:right-handed parallel beta-helix repeat-containing protein n=1 Tax=Empedobacter brevis TaxID=247 RepID=UPI003340FF3C